MQDVQDRGKEKMKRGKIFFHPIEGSAQLSISWSSAPKGDAIEAKSGSGVGFFSAKGDLLSVIFDEVSAAEDHQVLEFSQYKVEMTVKKGKVAFKVHNKKHPIKPSNRSVSRKRPPFKTKR